MTPVLRFRPGVGALVALSPLTLGAFGCVDVSAFECEDDVQCQRLGRQGHCEPVGYCSYADPECEGGRRFSPNAGELADACTDRTPNASATGAQGSGGGASSGELMSVDDFTGPGEDAFVDVETVPGSDSTAQTVIVAGVVGGSGQVLHYDPAAAEQLWSQELGTGSDSVATSLGFDAAGRVHVSVQSDDVTPMAGYQCLRISAGTDCGTAWAQHDSFIQASAVTVRPLAGSPSAVVVGGAADEGAAMELSGAGVVNWENSYPAIGAFVGVTALESSVYAATSAPPSVWELTPEGEARAVWLDDHEGAELAVVRTVETVDGNLLLAGRAGTSNAQPYAVVVATDGATVARWSSSAYPVAEAYAAVELADGRTVLVGAGADDPGEVDAMWIAMLDVDMSPAWESTYPEVGEGSTRARGVRELSGGTLVVVGSIGAGASADAFIARVSG